MIKFSWIHTVYINTSESFYLSVSSYADKSSLQDLVLLVSILVSGLLHASCFPFFLLKFSSVFLLEVLL